MCFVFGFFVRRKAPKKKGGKERERERERGGTNDLGTNIKVSENESALASVFCRVYDRVSICVWFLSFFVFVCFVWSCVNKSDLPPKVATQMLKSSTKTTTNVDC